MNIVIVDDDRIIRMGLIKIIKRIFYNDKIVGQFENGYLAYNFIKKNEVDLVITGIIMPVMDGLQLISKCNKRNDTSPLFVVVSGYDDFHYIRESMELGAFSYLIKPINDNEIKEVIFAAKEKSEFEGYRKNNIGKSLNDMKQELFKHILLEDKELIKDYNLLKSMGLNDKYVYKLVAISGDDSESNKKYITFIEDKYLVEHITFYHESNSYIVFYFSKDNVNISSFNMFISDRADYIVKDNRNVYALNSVDEIWKLRTQAKVIRNGIDNEVEIKKAKKFILKDNYILNKYSLDKSRSRNNNKMKITSNESIDLAKEFICSNYNKNISLKDVADAVFISSNYLSDLFKREIGEGFYYFLTNYRIEKAKEILRTSNMKIYEVASNVGYNDSISFCRAFKKVTGTTPKNFRNNK